MGGREAEGRAEPEGSPGVAETCGEMRQSGGGVRRLRPPRIVPGSPPSPPGRRSPARPRRAAAAGAQVTSGAELSPACTGGRQSRGHVPLSPRATSGRGEQGREQDPPPGAVTPGCAGADGCGTAVTSPPASRIGCARRRHGTPDPPGTDTGTSDPRVTATGTPGLPRHNHRHPQTPPVASTAPPDPPSAIGTSGPPLSHRHPRTPRHSHGTPGAPRHRYRHHQTPLSQPSAPLDPPIIAIDTSSPPSSLPPAPPNPPSPISAPLDAPQCHSTPRPPSAIGLSPCPELPRVSQGQQGDRQSERGHKEGDGGVVPQFPQLEEVS
ncbi:collagen alpha-1(XVII) chain-like [Melospiza melodia melodia]|uniref:collagen alpha-1(XVII) chain-like n=1 Tax=Melospiza melodia melodia TaxID=1914991 RepID=UPI002FD170E5